MKNLRYGDLLFKFLSSAEKECQVLSKELPGTTTVAAVRHGSKDNATPSPDSPGV